MQERHQASRDPGFPALRYTEGPLTGDDESQHLSDKWSMNLTLSIGQ